MTYTKWQKEIVETVTVESNYQLLSKTLWLANGDDYDGCMTARGQWQYNYRLAELTRRLVDTNFLNLEERQLIIDNH